MDVAPRKRVHKTDIIYPFKSVWAFLLANLGLGLIITLLFSMDFTDTVRDFLVAILWGATISITQWVGHAYLATIIDHRISWLEAPLKRAIVAVVVMVVYTVVAFLAVQLAIRWAVYGVVPDNIPRWALDHSLVPLIFSFVIAWSLAARSFYISWRDSEGKAQKLQIEMLNYRYEALRNQINPHFLFNSFNVLSDLVYEDQELAVRFIRQLSDLYRYVLDSREKELVPLKEELDFIRAYIFLLRTRFEEKLDIVVELEPGADEMIVPMTLQLLIENAVKHNEASRKHPLRVVVRRLDDEIEVRNNLKTRSVGDDSKKTGLKNIRQQYAHLSDRGIGQGQTEEEFFVRFPILQNTKT